uniref:Uncharacterized protein n=1 Tax=Macrostomum lignano TaxID=282301 RepID=A0A1I8FNK3_9PLAT
MDGFRQFKAAKPPQQHQQQPKLKFGMSAILGCNDSDDIKQEAPSQLHRQFTKSDSLPVATTASSEASPVSSNSLAESAVLHQQHRAAASAAPHCILSLLLDSLITVC